MEKTQREYYLNEQMKAIQKELGDSEDGKDDDEDDWYGQEEVNGGVTAAVTGLPAPMLPPTIPYVPDPMPTEGAPEGRPGPMVAGWKQDAVMPTLEPTAQSELSGSSAL